VAPEDERDDRPLPFILRVAAEWIDIDDSPGPDDNEIFYRKRARLTGFAGVTAAGDDVHISDVGLSS
jgi:hypothetical protein